MPTRVLCLHGMGTQASIFASQTACIRELLPSSYQFVFVDGPVACSPAPEVAHIFPGPYLCWYTSPSTNRVAAAHKHLQYLIKTKGPFDGVLGFSQGAALAASLLLHHQINSPDQPAPFKAAIFICSPVPFSTSVEYGIDTRAYFGIETMQLSRPHCPDQVPKHLITDPAYLNGEVETGQDGQHSTFYQMFHPTVDTCRIAVPTLHVYGKRDKWRLHSRDLYELCEPATANCLEHDAGHEVPAAYAEEIADAVESTMFKGR